MVNSGVSEHWEWALDGVDTPMSLQVWKLEDGDTHWVVAASEEDARSLLVEDMQACGLDYYQEGEITSCEALPPNEPFIVHDEDEGPAELLASEWAAQGRGYLCGSCW
jgi:hypothetical protein